MRTRKNDCDIILNSAENVFNDLGNCIGTAFNDRKTKMNVVGSIFSLGKSLTKLAFNTTGCAIKNTPKAVVAVTNAKRELVSAIEEELHEQKKQAQKDALEEKIKQLK